MTIPKGTAEAQGGIKNKHSSFPGLQLSQNLAYTLFSYIKFEGGGAEKVCILCFSRKSFYFALVLFPKKECRLLRSQSMHSLGVQQDHLLRKTQEGKLAKFPCLTKADECQAGSHPHSVLLQKAKLPLGSHCQHSTQTMPGSLTIVHSIFICESPSSTQCAKPFFSQERF